MIKYYRRSKVDFGMIGNGETPVGLRDRHDRSVVLTADAKPLQNQMKLARVDMVEPSSDPVSLVCDEGGYLGGDGSAPAPLVYFTASIAFCMLTQIGRYAKIMRLQLDHVRLRVTTRFHIEGSVKEDTLRGAPLDFEFDVEIDSPEDQEKVQRLLRTSEASCYVTQSLLQQVTIDHTATLNGQELTDAIGTPAS